MDRYRTDDSYRDWFDLNYRQQYPSIYAAVGLPEPGGPGPAAADAGGGAEPDAAFAVHMDADAGPHSYVGRYRTDDSYRDWFDLNFAGKTIHAAAGLPEPAPFVDPQADPHSYVDRYRTDDSYREWFDLNYRHQYPSIYAAAGLPEPKPVASFVDPDRDPRYYVSRYESELAYREWFDANFPGYTIYEAVGTGMPDSPADYGECGIGTRLVSGECVRVRPPQPVLDTPPAGGASGTGGATDRGGGCLVATAAYGTELAPQVQHLREVRDGALLRTDHGASFMAAFSSLYYAFSPAVADMEREMPALRAMVAALLAPMLASLSLMPAADPASPGLVLAAGASIIALNVAIYVAAPAAAAAWATGRMRRRLGARAAVGLSRQGRAGGRPHAARFGLKAEAAGACPAPAACARYAAALANLRWALARGRACCLRPARIRMRCRSAPAACSPARK